MHARGIVAMAAATLAAVGSLMWALAGAREKSDDRAPLPAQRPEIGETATEVGSPVPTPIEDAHSVPPAADVEDLEARETRQENSVALAAATLRVRVVDEREIPWCGARVWITEVGRGGFNDRVECETAADGIATVANITAGERQVWTSAGGVLSNAKVQLVGGATTDLTIVIAREGTLVEGTVRDRETGPLAGVTVHLERRGARGHDSLRTTTDEAGRYRIEVVPPGIYRLEVRGLMLHYPTIACGDLVVDMERVTKNIDLGCLGLTGVVRDAVTRQPLAGVSVELQKPVSRRWITDAEGTYRLYEVPPGDGKLVLVKDGYELLFTDAGRFVTDEKRTLDFLLYPAALLNLHLADERGQPVVGQFQLHWTNHADRSTSVSTDVTADEDGHAAFRSVRPGMYDLWVTWEGLKSAPQRFEVRAGENTIHVHLQGTAQEGAQPAILTGRVTDATTGKPIRGVRIQIQTRPKRTAYTDVSGTYHLGGPPGTVTLHVSRDGYGFRAIQNLRLSDKEKLLDITLEPAATLILRILDRAGRPYVGPLTLAVTPVRDRDVIRFGSGLEADEQGRATYRQLLPGAYELRVVVAEQGSCSVRTTISVGDNAIHMSLK